MAACTSDDLEFKGLTKSGQFEERVEQAHSPVFNCKSRTATLFTIQRQRTVEKSVNVQMNGQLQATFYSEVLASKIGELVTTIGAQYGWTTSESRTDSSSLQFTVNPGEQVIYMVTWHEKWEGGIARVAHGGQIFEIPYFYLTAAQPEISDILYLDCNEQGYATATAMAIAPVGTETPPPVAMIDASTEAITQAITQAMTVFQPLASTPSGLLYQPLLDQYGMDFVYVPAGDFVMGSTEQQIDDAVALCQKLSKTCPRGWFTDEAPQHVVRTDAYWLGKTEVTNRQYRAVVDNGGYTIQSLWTTTGWQWRNDNYVTQPGCWTDKDLNGDNQPVVCISWYEAMAYAGWLKAQTGLDVRLPTETQWEKAARGSDGRIFPWGNEWDSSRLNGCDKSCSSDGDKSVDDGFAQTAPVGSFPVGASPSGALDMAGNVWEWTSTLDKVYPYQADDGRENPEGDAGRVLRGGSWNLNAHYVRAAYRAGFPPDNRINVVGVRVVVVAPQ